MFPLEAATGSANGSLHGLSPANGAICSNETGDLVRIQAKQIPRRPSRHRSEETMILAVVFAVITRDTRVAAEAHCAQVAEHPIAETRRTDQSQTMKSLCIIIGIVTPVLTGIGCSSDTAANGASPMSSPDSFSGSGGNSGGAGGK
jgi:hypothetical protein